VLTILSKKQIKRAISWNDPNFLIVHATRTQAGNVEVSAVSLHYDAKFNWCLYLIILTSSIKTGAACSPLSRTNKESAAGMTQRSSRPTISARCAFNENAGPEFVARS
jgi:hypothetical protein